MSENEFNPNWCTSPGDTIVDILYERNITLEYFSNGIKLSLDETNKLLTGDFEINNDLAQKLGEFFGNSTQFWINRENKYRERLKIGLKRI